MWGQVQPLLAEGDFDHAREMTNDDKSTIAQMLSMGLARQGAVRRREDIEIAMEECMMEIIPQLEKRTPYIALLSNIATLLGLLGTIMGLIEAFTAVDNAKPRRDGLGQGAQLHLQFLQASVPGGCPGWVNTGDSLPRPPLLPMAPSAITTDKGLRTGKDAVLLLNSLLT
jgi:hypothetical protein